MASCLVPDFPAVLVALEHLKELDKQLREEGVPFSAEASLHLTQITTSISELEADRRAAHEHLEVETIENSKLRHQINNIRDRMSQDIVADVAAARASNAEEIRQLHNDLSTVSQLQQATVKRQEALLSQNKELDPEREQVTAEHEELIAAQSDQIALKYGLQTQLDHTLDQTEELRSCIAAVQQDKITVQEKMVLQKEAFMVKKDDLCREVEQAEEKIQQQKHAIRRSRKELDRLTDKKQDSCDRLGELMVVTAKLERSIQKLAAARGQSEKQLQGENQKHQELRQQRETLKKELRELVEAFSASVQHLKDEVATVEGKMDEGRASRLLCQDALAQIYEIFKHQHKEEDEVRSGHFHASQQLECSKLQLEERIASIVKHSKEVKEMEKQIRELLEADTITQRVFQRNQEELCDNVDTERKNISHFEEEVRRLTRLLEEDKKKQEEHMMKMTSDISNTWRRYQKLRQEEFALHKRQPKSTSADLLMSHVSQCEAEYRRKETKQLEEMQQCTTETESIMRSYKEKQREVEEKEEMLKEVEAKWNEEQLRHQRLKTLSHELRSRRNHLERSVQRLKEKTDSVLQPREEKKAELEEVRGSYMDVLGRQASELRAVEVSIYDSSMKVEQVSVENSRLRLCITQMTEDISRARENKNRYWQEFQQFKQDTEALLESLHEAWREDILVTEDCGSRDGVLLVQMSNMLNHLKTRRQQLVNISSLLHQQMLNFSKRLGDQAAVEQQS
ncbi:golgin subfamily A member 6-like protein 7 [Plectropomus leopardus]|uniref:golgin subfamily A member 6-like protein 7 n=1 Tax=Plectropomus leopardus TaxID=160734 RepID=UPI001C4DAF72|nr:golgin subfamily A member 6-like protein 7 [Plectropomus leopardus]